MNKITKLAHVTIIALAVVGLSGCIVDGGHHGHHGHHRDDSGEIHRYTPDQHRGPSPSQHMGPPSNQYIGP